MPKRDLLRKLDANPVKIIGGTVGGAVGGTVTDADTLNGQYPAFYLNRDNHTGTQLAATISDFDAEVSNNVDVAANTAARHAAVTVLDTASVDFTLTGQAISAVVLPAGVDHNSLLNYSSNRHIDHSGVSVTGAGALGGGGAITAGSTITMNTPGGLSSTTTNTVGTNHTHAIDTTLARSAVTITAGAGLTGGGDISANRTLAVGAGTGITVNADDVAITAGANYQFMGTGSGTAAGWRNVSELAGGGLDCTTGVLKITSANTGIAVGTDNITLTLATTSGLAISSGLLLADTVAGDGLTITNKVMAVGVANTGAAGLTVEADAVRLTSSSAPGATAKILATDASGFLTIPKLTTTTKVVTPLIDTASGALTFSPATDLILSPVSLLTKLADGTALQSHDYASQTTGARITDDGQADFRYLFVDEMHAKSFIADLEQALAGGQIISKSVAMLGAAFTAPAAGATATLTVRDLPSAANMAVFQSGDIVRLRTFSRTAGSLTVGDCWGVVTAYANQSDDTQTWTFTRSAAPNAGAITAGTVIAPDSLALDYGTTGNGFHEVNAIDGAYGVNSPYSQVVSWATHPATGQTVRTRLGNLNGIFAVANEYGLYAGGGTADTNSYLRFSNEAARFNNVDITLFNGATQTVNIAKDGSSWFKNDMEIGDYSGGAGLFFDQSAGTLSVSGGIFAGNGATFHATDVLLHVPFSYAGGYRANTNGSGGQQATETGAVIGVPGGPFGNGALQTMVTATNIITNPTFESGGSAYWAWYNATAAYGTDTMFGSRCASIVSNNGSLPYIYSAGTGLTVSAGTSYTFSAYVKAGNTTSIGASVTAYLRENGGGAATVTTSTSVTLTDDWQLLSVTHTIVEAGRTAINHWVLVNSTTATMLVSAVQLTATAYRLPFFYGDMPGCVWDTPASPYASTSIATGSLIDYSVSNISAVSGTISMWVNPTGYNSNSSFFWAGGYQNNEFDAYINANGILFFRQNAVSEYASGAIPLNAWTHLTFTWQIGGKYQIYKNGVLNVEGDYTELVTLGTRLSVGGSALLSTDYNLPGYIADFFTASRAYTADEIAAIYQSGSPVVVAHGTHELFAGSSAGYVSVNENGIFAKVGTSPSFALANKNGITWASPTTTLDAGDFIFGEYGTGKGGWLSFDRSAAQVVLGYGTTAGITLNSGGVSVVGAITANTGYIGGVSGWTIAAKTITGASDSKIVSGILQSSDWGTSAGGQIDLYNKTIKFGGSSAPKFSVASDGALSATGASITGAITATSGSITGTLAIGSTGDLKLNVDTASGGLIRWTGNDYGGTERTMFRIATSWHTKTTIKSIPQVEFRGWTSLLTPTDAILGVLVAPGYSIVTGNARGMGAVDWQSERSLNTQVASGESSVICGGKVNTASGDGSVVLGGQENTASGGLSTIGGGGQNEASNGYSTVAGGNYNTASGSMSTVPGGLLNTAAGNYSLAAGYRAKANHQGAFVWADSTDADYASTASNQFRARATGGAYFSHGITAGTTVNAVSGYQVNGTSAGVFIPLTTPITHTSFDGDLFSDVSTATKIENTSWSTSIPETAKALLLEITVSDSGTFPTGGLYFACGPSSTYWYTAIARPLGGGHNATATVVCPTTSGDIYYEVNASGTSTLTANLRIWGYFI